ncbi:MAG: hypothetical protein ISS70_05125 [Phycisphaerae bacterium]|nr:hypothetical protein [Phycisphaerae bacterium]
MISIYWHCLGLTGNDEGFVNGALQELVQHLREDPIRLPANIKALNDEPKVAKEINAILNRLCEQSYTFKDAASHIQEVLLDSLLDRVKSSNLGFFIPSLLVYCHRDSAIARSALREDGAGPWGAECCGFAAVYESGNKFVIWHEALHLLGAHDCYEEDDPYRRKPDCNCNSCTMQYVPTEDTVGKWSLCDKNVKKLKDLAEEARKVRRAKKNS